MIMEICQTLLLYTEPKKREKEDRFEKMKFRMQLSAGEDTKGDIQELQNCVRYHNCFAFHVLFSFVNFHPQLSCVVAMQLIDPYYPLILLVR